MTKSEFRLLLNLDFSFSFANQIADGEFTFLIERIGEYEWLITICLLVLSGLLFWFDYKKDQNN